jgi:hypothetical protein
MAVVKLRDARELFEQPGRTDIWVLAGRRRAYGKLVSDQVEVRSA